MSVAIATPDDDDFERSMKPEADFESFIRATTQNIAGGLYGFIIEAFLNALDAGATVFLIVVQGGRGKRVSEIWFCDNGMGMGEQGSQSFVDLARSLYRNQPDKRGKYGFGSKSFMHKFGDCIVYDFWQGIPASMVDTFAINWDAHIRRYEKSNAERVMVTRVARDSVEAMLPEGATHGVCIKLTNPLPGAQIPTADALVKHLSPKLHPEMAKMILVYDGKEVRPLQTRDLVGENITYQERNHGELGTVDVRVFIPRKTSQDDELHIGWCRIDKSGRFLAEPICTWREMLRNCPEDCWDDELNIIGDPSVKGYISVEKFMSYRSGNSDSFTQELYQSPAFRSFQRALKLQVVPRLYDMLDAIRSHKAAHKAEEFRKFLNETVGTAPVDQVRPEPKRPILQIKPGNLVQLLYGEKLSVEVFRRDPSIDVVRWKMEPDTGHLIPRTGLKVEFTAPRKQGEVKLTAYDEADESCQDSVRIMVLPERQLRISPQNPTIPPGHQVELHAVHFEDSCDVDMEGRDLVWTADPEDAGGGFVVERRGKETLENTARGSLVIYQAGSEKCAEGFTITLCIAGRQRSPEAKCSVVVADRVQGGRVTGSRGVPELGQQLVLEDILYTVHPRTHNPLPGENPVIIQPGVGKSADVIFNFQHPTLKALQSESHQWQEAATLFYIAHVEYWHPKYSAQDVARLINQLKAERAQLRLETQQ